MTAQSRTWPKKALKFASLAIVSLAVLLLVANLVWRFSGSNQWELVQDKNGVKVYSLKTPGSELLQIKGVVQVHSTLGGLVKFMQDPNVCADYGCYESYTVERVDDQLQYVTFRMDFPRPFQTREFVVRTQVHQDAHTKEVLLEYAAAPDKMPANACCFRVTDMNNTFRFTPRGNGQVDVEYVMNMNEGGFIPPPLLNRVRPKVSYRVLRVLQGLLEKHGYQDAKLDFIDEA